MIPEEVLKKIHLIHIRTKHLVNDVMAGEYESAFRGRGSIRGEAADDGAAEPGPATWWKSSGSHCLRDQGGRQSLDWAARRRRAP